MFHLLCYVLLALTTSPSFRVREGATQALCFLRGYSAVPLQATEWAAKSPDPEVRARVRIVLNRLPIYTSEIVWDRIPRFPSSHREFKIRVLEPTQEKLGRLKADVQRETGATWRRSDAKDDGSSIVVFYKP